MGNRKLKLLLGVLAFVSVFVVAQVNATAGAGAGILYGMWLGIVVTEWTYGLVEGEKQ